MKFERIVEFTPAYDKRSNNPKKNYGIGSVRIRFVLKKGKRAVQFLIGTHWFLKETVLEYLKIGNKGKTRQTDLRVDASYNDKGESFNCWDLGYHSPKPMYKGATPINDDCQYTGGKCYYDGSGLNAEPVGDILLKEGSEGVWKYLEKYWNTIFGKEKGEE